MAGLLPQAYAQDANTPLILATPPANAAAGHDSIPSTPLGPNGGASPYGLLVNALVGSWIDSTAGKQIKQFKQSTPGTDWGDLAAQTFACVGVPRGGKCRNVLMFTGRDADLQAKLQALRSSRAIVIVLLQQFDGTRYRARATLREVELLASGAPKTQRVFTVIYNTDAPDDIRGDSQKVRDYWTAGPQSLLTTEAQASLSEMSDMLDTLFLTDHDDHSPPDGWKELKSIKQFEASGLARCHGALCWDTRAFAEHGNRIWIASDIRSREEGWLLISLDRNAALRNSNFQFQSLPIL